MDGDIFRRRLKQIFIDINWENEVRATLGRDTFSGFGSAVIAHGINSWAITRVNGVLPTVYSGVQVAFTVLFGLTFLTKARRSSSPGSRFRCRYCVARSRADEREEESGLRRRRRRRSRRQPPTRREKMNTNAYENKNTALS